MLIHSVVLPIRADPVSRFMTEIVIYRINRKERMFHRWCASRAEIVLNCQAVVWHLNRFISTK